MVASEESQKIPKVSMINITNVYTKFGAYPLSKCQAISNFNLLEALKEKSGERQSL